MVVRRILPRTEVLCAARRLLRGGDVTETTRSFTSIPTNSPVAALHAALDLREDIVVHRPSIAPNHELVDRMLRSARASGVATASPIPLPSQREVGTYALHDALPPAPT